MNRARSAAIRTVHLLATISTASCTTDASADIRSICAGEIQEVGSGRQDGRHNCQEGHATAACSPIDVQDHIRRVCLGIIAPQLCPVATIVRLEEQRASEPSEELRVGAVLARLDVGDHSGATGCDRTAITCPQLNSMHAVVGLEVHKTRRRIRLETLRIGTHGAFDNFDAMCILLVVHEPQLPTSWTALCGKDQLCTETSHGQIGGVRALDTRHESLCEALVCALLYHDCLSNIAVGAPKFASLCSGRGCKV